MPTHSTKQQIATHIQEKLNPLELFLVNIICTFHGITITQFFGKKRSTRINNYRHLFYTVLRYLGYSYKEIAYTANKSHSTIVYHLKRPMSLQLVTTYHRVLEEHEKWQQQQEKEL